MLPIAGKLDDIGFYSMEVWGGATFDVTTRFLNEDPWDRVRILKAAMPKTKFQMLLRGQNLVGYRQYADDVVEAFVAKAAEVGIDIFRIFDALNDERNFITAYKAVKKAGKHIQGTLSYALTQRRMGGPIFTSTITSPRPGSWRRWGPIPSASRTWQASYLLMTPTSWSPR